MPWWGWLLVVLGFLAITAPSDAPAQPAKPEYVSLAGSDDLRLSSDGGWRQSGQFVYPSGYVVDDSPRPHSGYLVLTADDKDGYHAGRCSYFYTFQPGDKINVADRFSCRVTGDIANVYLSWSEAQGA